MADTEQNTRKIPKPTKKKGLPPLSQTGDGEENEQNVKPIKRRVKKKVPTESDERVDSPNGETKPTPARRRKRSPSQTKKAREDVTSAEDTITTPKKKKKKPKKTTEDQEGEEPDQNQNADSPSQSARDGQGSKTSLIGKEEETPRKKAGGKKKKKVKKSPTLEEDEYGDSPWAEDMRTLEEDVITGTDDFEEEDDGGDGDDKRDTLGTRKMTQMFVTAPVMKSQALDKIFVETSTKFKGQTKSALKKQQYEDTSKIAMPQEASKTSTSDFAIASNNLWRTCTLFLHGLTAGLALWQMVLIFQLTSFGAEDFLSHYRTTAMPLQGALYFLLAVCTVAQCDRFDIGHPTRQFVLRAFTLQNGAVSIVFCLAALVLNVVALGYEDRMYLYTDYPDLYSSEDMKSSDIDTFKSVNTARSVFILLSWLVLSITPDSDRLGESLKSGRTGLEGEVEMDKVTSA